MKDTYKTITKASEEVLFKDRNSKFFGYAFPVKNEEEANLYLEELKSKHHKARHWCYAWQTGKEEQHYLSLPRHPETKKECPARLL